MEDVVAVRVDVKIMAHPVRRPYVEELLDQLDRDVEVVWDSQPRPSRDPRQRWRVARRAWLSMDQEADWGLVLQDDAVVCQDLVAGVEKALDHIGTEGLASFYTGTGRPDQENVQRALATAAEGGHSWLSTRSLNWGVAICAPIPTIRDMVRWSSHPGRGAWKTDYRVGVYYRDVAHYRTWYTAPSLVEHRGVPSLVGHDTGPVRRAHNFIGTNVSALTVDWARTPRDFTPYLPVEPRRR